ncbi:hypothetical protein [Nocardia farcinica]|nr:hypothetical protein [Nocardia farcinica]
MPDPIFITTPDGSLVGAMSAEQLRADAERLMLELAAAASAGDTTAVAKVAASWRQRLDPEHLGTVALTAAARMAVEMVAPMLAQLTKRRGEQ